MLALYDGIVLLLATQRSPPEKLIRFLLIMFASQAIIPPSGASHEVGANENVSI